MKVGRLTLNDRATAGIDDDCSGPEIEQVVQELFAEPMEFVRARLPDDSDAIRLSLIRLADVEQCPLILTTGGTGPSPRDVTPEATRAVIEKELPGFGEVMRLHCYDTVKTSILSRGLAGIRGESLLINLPGDPAAIAECLPLLAPAIAECLDHIAGIRPKLASESVTPQP